MNLLKAGFLPLVAKEGMGDSQHKKDPMCYCRLEDEESIWWKMRATSWSWKGASVDRQGNGDLGPTNVRNWILPAARELERWLWGPDENHSPSQHLVLVWWDPEQRIQPPYTQMSNLHNWANTVILYIYIIYMCMALSFLNY